MGCSSAALYNFELMIDLTFLFRLLTCWSRGTNLNCQLQKYEDSSD